LDVKSSSIEWRKLNNEQLHNLYSSPNIIRQINSKRLRWTGHVARVGEERNCTRFWWESPKERDDSEDRGVDRRLLLKYFAVKSNVKKLSSKDNM
jgi:hypothetical protein